ncbi:hypothetical protein GCM10023187_40990 [Nibrella viscosa]|uniref:Peptidyl-prolyl cis-trans isomerase n=1 Tax=Nibrella viscosa TaxID=1084524 RepID=A0ABP8KQ89_9BACT
MFFKTLGKAVLVAAVMVACDRNRVQVTDSGLKYQIHEQNEDTRKAKVGDIMTMHLALKNSKDSVLRDTHKEPTPLKIMLQVPPFKGSFEEGLAMLSKGDSATFYVSADSLFSRAMQPLPPGVTKGSDIAFTVKVIDVQNEEEYTKAQSQLRDKQKGVDEKIIADYVAKNNLGGKVQKTASGLHYIINQPGTGPQPKPGDMVKVHYTGKLLNGKVFDSSVPRGQPIDFQVGVGMIIPGWEEGVMLMREGAKGTLIIPSTLAYGSEGSGGVIPPNSVLIFDIDLLNVKKGPAGGPGAPGAPAPGGAGGAGAPR